MYTAASGIPACHNPTLCPEGLQHQHAHEPPSCRVINVYLFQDLQSPVAEDLMLLGCSFAALMGNPIWTAFCHFPATFRMVQTLGASAFSLVSRAEPEEDDVNPDLEVTDIGYDGDWTWVTFSRDRSILDDQVSFAADANM